MKEEKNNKVKSCNFSTISIPPLINTRHGGACIKTFSTEGEYLQQ